MSENKNSNGIEENGSHQGKIIRLKKALGDITKFKYIGEWRSKKKCSHKNEIDIVRDEIGEDKWYNHCKNSYMKVYEKRNGVIWPKICDVCACGHWIKTNCYIECIERTKCVNKGDILVLGHCCIKLFDIGKICSKCGVQHKRTKFDVCIACERREISKFKYLNCDVCHSEMRSKLHRCCKTCRVEKKRIQLIGNKLMTFGKYKSMSIADLFKKDQKYVKLCIDTFEKNKELNFKPIYEYSQLITKHSAN